jgi:two-component system sensor histidine kinase PhoQ
MHSLNARITLGAGIVLAVFIVISAVALEKAFRDSAHSAREERLLAQIYLLMAAAEVNDDGVLEIADKPAEPKLDLPGSGLYASIVDGENDVVWQSRSTLSVRLPPVSSLSAGERKFARNAHADQPYLVTSYGVNWSTVNGSYPFTFIVTEDAGAYQEQLNIFRRSLWGSLSAMAVLLLVAQWFTLRWGLLPLRHVASELGRLEVGKQQQISGHYPSEVQRLTDGLNAVLSHERTQRQRYRDALADLAHSLKTPLALIRGALGENESARTASIEEQIGRMDRIIGYHLQRAAASGRTAMTLPVALRPAVDKILAALDKVHFGKTIAASVDIDPDLRFRGDESDLTEILGNILDNAFKWCRKAIRISAKIDDGWLRIRVEDDGPGIDGVDSARVLLRGARADESVPGHGIGLAVVREIVEAYDGRINIDNSALGGALIDLHLPGDA